MANGRVFKLLGSLFVFGAVGLAMGSVLLVIVVVAAEGRGLPFYLENRVLALFGDRFRFDQDPEWELVQQLEQWADRPLQCNYQIPVVLGYPHDLAAGTEKSPTSVSVLRGDTLLAASYGIGGRHGEQYVRFIDHPATPEQAYQFRAVDVDGRSVTGPTMLLGKVSPIRGFPRLQLERDKDGPSLTWSSVTGHDRYLVKFSQSNEGKLLDAGTLRLAPNVQRLPIWGTAAAWSPWGRAVMPTGLVSRFQIGPEKLFKSGGTVTITVSAEKDLVRGESWIGNSMWCHTSNAVTVIGRLAR